MKSLGIFLIALAFGPAVFAENLPSITCYNVLNASYSLTIKTFKTLPTHTNNGNKIYLANVITLSGSHIESSELESLQVDAFNSGRRSGFTYSINRQDRSEISLTSSCLYGPDICSSPSFTGKITEPSGAIHNLTCRFE